MIDNMKVEYACCVAELGFVGYDSYEYKEWITNKTKIFRQNYSSFSEENFKEWLKRELPLQKTIPENDIGFLTLPKVFRVNDEYNYIRIQRLAFTISMQITGNIKHLIMVTL